MPTFLSITSFEPRIVSYLVSYLFSLMDMRWDPFLFIIIIPSIYFLMVKHIALLFHKD
ncbi:hypothetical protein DJ46_5867 (plasmid) [Bacillus anthracis str. Vollum]|nr:hypothetical protein DJ46_5867 [Bacillus anthracis str. Vollum]AJH48666.1 hypothetical protein BG01_5877 [Bacillus anthracis]KFJ83900.1 hypothetical protein DJ42_5417 [Bacillus anthracis]